MVHVRAEFGPTARIVRAERVRSGGVAGFFAKERYELTIDVPDTPTRPAQSLLQRRGIAAVSATSGGGGIDALLAAADAADSGPDGFTGSTTVLAAADVPEQRAPRVSTGEEAFVSVLEQMRAMTGAVVPEPRPARTGEVAPDGPPPAAERTFEPMLPPVVPAPAPAPAVEQLADAGSGSGSGDGSAPVTGVPRAALADLGVPPALLAACGTGPVELSRLLAAVPSAPPLPREPGTVLVVAGPPEDAARVADLLALRVGAADVVHAGDAEPGAVAGRRLTAPSTAARWRAELQAADGVTVVALGVRPGRAREDAAAELLAALAPDQAWGVVDARSKTRDCARWIAGVGARRPLDALAVGGLFDTSEPGTVLSLGVPVAWIDGVPASRVAWAAALGEHLPEGTVWG